MKKFFYVMTEIILFLISVIVFTKPALADVNYDITNVDVTARVNPNGSLSMERRPINLMMTLMVFSISKI